jgi:hypothetical protein
MNRTQFQDATFEDIAKSALGIGTLKPQGDDALDFHDVSVWCRKQALIAAYEFGRNEPADVTEG